MTADFSIRLARPTDAAAVVALRATVFPYLVRGVASTRRVIASPPPGEDQVVLLAERDGVPAGSVIARRQPRAAEPGAGQVSLLHVHPEHRGRGVGSALLGAATSHLRSVGVHRVSAFATPEAAGFARRRGFEPSRAVRYSAVDLTGFGVVPPPAADDIRLIPLRDVEERALHDADVAAATDEPGDVPSQPAPYATWRYECWEEPGLDRDASIVALADDRIVSFSLLLRDGDRAWSDMTATVPEHRGRGLARLVKTAALARAAAGGVRTAYTCNDESNAAMLAVNERLGYRPVATQLSCLTEL